MSFLIIDLSTQPGNLILKIKNNLFYKVLQKDNHSNDILMLEILSLFKKNKRKLEHISKIFVNLGPGSFSGIRGSIATSQGISLASKTHIFGYSSFQLLRSNYYQKIKPYGFLIKINNNYLFQLYGKVNKFGIVQKLSRDTIITILKKNIIVSSLNYSQNMDPEILKSQNFKLIKVNYNKLELLYDNNLLQKKFIEPLYV
jgi:tRNA A37 threonylcarbamoyladenosine modification protein TsaB